MCKEDEGEYCAILSGDINGNEYENIRRNTICLHIIGGTIGDKQHTKVDEGRLTHSLFYNIFWFQFQRSHK